MIDVPNTLLEKGYEGLTSAEVSAVLEYALNEIRSRRNNLLKLTDVYALPDYPFASEADRQSFLDYRKSLRDFPIGLSPTYNTKTMELQGVDFPSHSLITDDMFRSTGPIHIKQ